MSFRGCEVSKLSYFFPFIPIAQKKLYWFYRTNGYSQLLWSVYSFSLQYIQYGA